MLPSPRALSAEPDWDVVISVTVTTAGAGGEKPPSGTLAILHEQIGRIEVPFIIWAALIERQALLKTEKAFMAAVGCRLVAGY